MKIVASLLSCLMIIVWLWLVWLCQLQITLIMSNKLFLFITSWEVVNKCFIVHCLALIENKLSRKYCIICVSLSFAVKNLLLSELFCFNCSRLSTLAETIKEKFGEGTLQKKWRVIRQCLNQKCLDKRKKIKAIDEQEQMWFSYIHLSLKILQSSHKLYGHQTILHYWIPWSYDIPFSDWYSSFVVILFRTCFIKLQSKSIL